MPAEQIATLASKLKLSYVKENIERFLLEGATEDYSLEAGLEILLGRECENRKHNGVKRKIRYAKFPYIMNFSDFTTAHLSPSVRREVRVLETLQFLEDRSNIIFIGNPGVGKTALSVAIGMKACSAEKSVAFINVPNFIIEIKEAMSLNQISQCKKNFEKYDLVILDDFGYCSFNKECGEVLFNLLSNRNEKGSMIITTNLMFDKWNQVFDDPVLTGAIVDRVAHKAHIIDMTGESYRVKETKEWINKALEFTDK